MEKVIRTLKPNIQRVMFPYLIGSVSLGVLVVIAVHTFLSLTSLKALSLPLAVVLGIVSGFFSYFEYHKRISSQRWVILESGILEEKEQNRIKTVDSIVSIALKQNTLDRLFGTGKIYLNNDVRMCGITDYKSTYEFIVEHVKKNRNL